MGDDFYSGAFGRAYSYYMARPGLSRLIGRLVWGGDIRHYYESMAALAELPESATVIDAPCGSGIALRSVHSPTAPRWLGADTSEAMLERARAYAAERGIAAEFIRADAAELPYPDASADLFLSYWGLHCFDCPASALAEARRVLKPEGRLMGSTFVRGKRLRQRALIRPHTGDFGAVGEQADVERWLSEAGFDHELLQSGPMVFFDARPARSS